MSPNRRRLPLGVPPQTPPNRCSYRRIFCLLPPALTAPLGGCLSGVALIGRRLFFYKMDSPFGADEVRGAAFIPPPSRSPTSVPVAD